MTSQMPAIDVQFVGLAFSDDFFLAASAAPTSRNVNTSLLIAPHAEMAFSGAQDTPLRQSSGVARKRATARPMHAQSAVKVHWCESAANMEISSAALIGKPAYHETIGRGRFEHMTFVRHESGKLTQPVLSCWRLIESAGDEFGMSMKGIAN